MSEAESSQGGPPLRIRVVGRALSATIARAPLLWPVLRGPMRRFFDAAAPDWDMTTDRKAPEKLAAFSAATLELPQRPESVLDLGTGTGEGALLLAREFPAARIRGVDISEEMIRQAQSKVGLDPEGRVVFRVADAGDLPYDEDSFDLVTQLNVPVFFAEVARVLRPGGHVIVASTMGPSTPFFTPHSVLERRFAKQGVSGVSAGEAGTGTWWLGRAGSP